MFENKPCFYVKKGFTMDTYIFEPNDMYLLVEPAKPKSGNPCAVFESARTGKRISITKDLLTRMAHNIKFDYAE